ncbi:RidA family protein [Candidatus Fermentibacteria bacterium]|nr:RidA family protein [Candidatus Fermentibacteria bacterium]
MTEVRSDDAPEPVGAYSQAVESGGFLFISGQIGLDPVSGELVEGLGEQAERALSNLRAVLSAAGLSMTDVVKSTVYLKDMSDFGKVNEVYARFFQPPYPARAAVEVPGLPKGALVEIEAVAREGGEADGG